MNKLSEEELEKAANKELGEDKQRLKVGELFVPTFLDYCNFRVT